MSRNILKWLLLAFVAVTVLTQIAKSFRTVEETTFADGKHLVFFHAKVRCPTCTTMERLVKETLDADFKDKIQSGVFKFRVLDYESPESKRIVEKYKIATATVLLFEQKEEKPVDGRNLAESCWKLIGDEPAFQRMLKTELHAFLSGNRVEQKNESTEIQLAPDLNLFEEEENGTTEKKNK